MFLRSDRQPPGRAVVELARQMFPPAGLDEKPMPPGTVGPAISVTATQLQPLLIASLGSLYVADDIGPPAEVIWYDHDSEVLVLLDRTIVRLGAGLVLVALTLETDADRRRAAHRAAQHRLRGDGRRAGRCHREPAARPGRPG